MNIWEQVMYYKAITITVFLSLLLISISAGTYTRGPDLILECSECRQQLIYKTTASGNNFGMRTWTDRYSDAPMMPDRPMIIKCPSCKSIVWIDELNQIAASNFNDTKEQYPDAEYPDVPSEADLLECASSRTLTRDNEIYARVRSLWAANHKFRYEEESDVHFSEDQYLNINRLMELLREDDDGERLVKAELAREIGDFDESLRLLSAEVSDDFADYRSFIEQLASARIREVREILEESETNTNTE